MRGFRDDTREYILTQAPLQDTVEDFYHMLWDRKVTCVVMMCRLVENGSVVCPRYMPTRSPVWSKIAAPTSDGMISSRTRVLTFGRFKVRLLKESANDVFTLTRVRVSNRAVGSRTLTHIAYHAWPDPARISVKPGDLISLVHLVRTAHRQHAAPLVVHCTSGADRAATLVLADVIMRQCEYDARADVLGAVCRMRQDRGCVLSSPVCGSSEGGGGVCVSDFVCLFVCFCVCLCLCVRLCVSVSASAISCLPASLLACAHTRASLTPLQRISTPPPPIFFQELYGLLYDVALTYLQMVAGAQPQSHTPNPAFDINDKCVVVCVTVCVVACVRAWLHACLHACALY